MTVSLQMINYAYKKYKSLKHIEPVSAKIRKKGLNEIFNIQFLNGFGDWIVCRQIDFSL